MSKSVRYLRITCAALCGVACVLLIALWVRSYWWSDGVQGPALWKSGFSLTSVHGRFMFGGGDEQDLITEWDFSSFEFDDKYGPGRMAEYLGPVFSFHLFDESGGYLHMPHWFLALVAGLIAFAFAKQRRYSLRTLLIIAAFISFGLGAIVYYSTHAEQGGFSGGGMGGLASDSQTRNMNAVSADFLTLSRYL